MKFVWIIGLGILSTIGLAGCASTDTANEPSSLDGSAWVLASLPDRSLIPDATPTARFDGDLVTGSDGCNRYSMPFKVKGSSIEIGPSGFSTLMACPETTMAQAAAFTAALQSARGFARRDGMLELLSADGAVVAKFSSQSQSLAGTSWNVTMINNGRQAIVGIVNDSTVTIELDREGRVSGTTGCNRYTGAYAVEGDSLRFSQIAATRMACADPALAEQEQHFLGALGAVATLFSQGDRIYLRRADGELALILIRDR
jgi:heat shock protein HslJ